VSISRLLLFAFNFVSACLSDFWLRVLEKRFIYKDFSVLAVILQYVETFAFSYCQYGAFRIMITTEKRHGIEAKRFHPMPLCASFL